MPEVGRRRLWRLAVTLDRSKLQIARGIRNAIGVFIPLAVGIAIGEVAAGVAASGGAVLVGFADVGGSGSYVTRARTMALAIVVVATAVFVGVLTGDNDWLTVLLMGVAGFGAGLCVALGQTASGVGLLAALSLLISAFYPAGLDEALVRAGLTAAGGLLQALIALAVWPLGPFRPERAAVADAYDALADFVDGTVAGKPTNDRIPALAAELTKARVLLDDSEGRAVSNTAAGEAFRTLMIEADRLYPEVVALGHVKADLPAPAAAATQDALAATAEALRAVAGELDGGLPASDQVESLRHRLRAATRTIGTEGDGPGPQAAMRLEAIRGQLRAAADAAVAWERPRAGSPVRRAVPRRPTLFPHDGIAVLRANLNLQSTAFRHALRLGVTLAVAVALYRILPVPRGYWIPLTVAFVMRPDFGSTFSRGAQRYAGTVVGAVAATALTAILDPGDWTLAVLVTGFAAVFYATLFANYAIFTAAVTAMIVFFVAFDGVHEWTAVVDRVLDTAIGGVLALAAYALFPTWEGDRVGTRLGDLIDANRRYCATVLAAWVDPTRYDADALHTARLEARRARTEADASVQMAQAEPARHRGDIDADLSVLASLRRFADGALALEAALEDTKARQARPALAPLAHDVDGTLSALAAAERDGDRPAALPRLRAEHDTFTATEPDDSLVVQETDRLVNAVDSLGHLLGAPAR